MSNLLDSFELEALRNDFKEMLGYQNPGHATETISAATTLVSIRRLVDQGALNESTGEYDSPSHTVIYSGPAHISPIVFRRDRQEQGGGQAIRVRQYRCVLPYDSGDIRIDDSCLINFSADPEMDGREWLVSDVMYESEVAARRVTLTDTAPPGAEDC